MELSMAQEAWVTKIVREEETHQQSADDSTPVNAQIPQKCACSGMYASPASNRDMDKILAQQEVDLIHGL